VREAAVEDSRLALVFGDQFEDDGKVLGRMRALLFEECATLRRRPLERGMEERLDSFPAAGIKCVVAQNPDPQWALSSPGAAPC
jgi:hypothetical protein